MKVFITGGAGFIGRHLVGYLLKSGNNVTVYDNFSNSFKEKLSYLANKITVIQGDVTDYDLVTNSLENVDAVVHLAANTDVSESFKNPKETFYTNVTGTKTLLQACVTAKVNKVLYASSAAVYGNTQGLPLTESSSTAPISPYAESKLEAENLMQEYATSQGLSCVSLRIFNAYGKGQTDAYTDVITKFAGRISKGLPPIIFGDGTNTRDFVSVEDVSSSFLCAFSNIERNRGKCYNIASGKHVTIKELAKLMISISGKSNLLIEYDKPRKGDIEDSQASILLAKKELEYYPKVELRQGLEKLLLKT